MKKGLLQNLFIKKGLLATLLVAAFIFSGTKSHAQCIAPTNSPTGTITVSPYIQTCLSGNMFTGSYTSFSVTAAGQYAILTSFGTFVTVTDNANTPLASGFGVALYTGILTPGVYRVHIYNTAGCSIGGGSRIVCVAPRNNAFSFDGVNDYIDLGTTITSSLTGKDKLTVEAWVNPNSNTGVHSIVGNHQGPTQFELRTNGNNFNFFIGFGSFGVTSVATVTLNTWTHVAGVFDQNIMYIYVNGVPSGSTAVTSFSFPASAISTKIGLDGFSSEFDGAIDEVRIWNRALCQGEILNNKNGPIPTSNSGLIANYHFNQGVGGGSNPTVTSLVDDSGNNINGTVMNAALTGATSNWIGSGSYPDNGSLAPFVSPNISITGTNTVCSGSSATLTASGVSTYTWVSGPSTATNVVSPTVATTYSVTGTNSLGCVSNMAQQTVSVTSLPSITVNSGSICSGDSFTITPSGATSYTYEGGNAVVSPTANTNYTVVGSTSGCVSNIVTSSLTVNALPIITVNSGSICSGSSFTMTPSGASTYTFSSGTAVVSPTATASYSVDGTDANGCVSAASAVSNVTVNICAAAEALNFDGINDYVNLGNSINSVLDPINKFTAEAWVLPSSTVSPTFDAIVGNYNTSAGGMQFLLRQSGNKYEFFVDAGSGFVGVGSAAATVSLNVWQHVAGTWDGSILKLYLNGVLSATNTAIGTSFNTHSNPVWIGGQPLNSEYFQGGLDEVRLWTRVLCQGEIQNNMNGEIPTTASGLLANYHFNQGIAAQPNPTVTTLMDASGNAYTGTLTGIALTGTTSNWIAPGAVTGTAPAFVPPTITVNSGSICSGNSFTMTPSGATNYTYEGGNAVVSPTASTNYTVVGSTLGCMSNVVTSSLTVNALPTITVNSGAICSGSSFTMTPSGASTYTYSSGSAVVSPTATSSYSVDGTDANGCVSAASAVSSVTVNSLPSLTVSTTSSVLCVGQTSSLSATGANTYTWNTSATGSVIAVSPTITTSYTVTGEDANGCQTDSVITQVVSPCTGINQLTVNAEEINIYPNPFNNKITIVTNGQKQNVIIFNSIGSIIYQEAIETEKIEIDLSLQASGIYFVQIGSTTKKIVKE